MAERVTDVLWSMLVGAGVKRCYGIVGDALNPVIDGLRRNGQVEFIHVRNEEAGTFAAVAEASLTEAPVAVCGTAGPGVMHLLNGLTDEQREGVPVIAIAGDTATGLIDSGVTEELNPYATFQVASLYTGRIVGSGPDAGGRADGDLHRAQRAGAYGDLAAGQCGRQQGARGHLPRGRAQSTAAAAERQRSAGAGGADRCRGVGHDLRR